MRSVRRAFLGVTLMIVAIVQASLHADTVQLTLRDGRISLVATNATPGQIFAAWSRAGGVLVVNAERMPVVPVTLRLDNVPEEQALETLLRQVSGYLALRRAAPTADGSVFERIVIFATSSAAPPSAVTAAPAQRPGSAGAPIFAQPPRPAAVPPPAAVQAPPPAPPTGIPVGPGVTRLVGSDGQPVEDDQAGAPQTPYNGGDAPDARPFTPPRGVPPSSPPPPPDTPSTSAPAGAPRPGMVVPAPPQTQQPR